jgi:putative transposase
MGGFSSMPRKLKRRHGQGDLHFITFSCYERRQLLGTVRARNLFVKILGEVRNRCGSLLVGYVVMPEHVHLLISEPGKGNFAQLVQVLKQRVSRAMRARKRRAPGQLTLNFPSPDGELRRFWQRRYYDFNVYSANKLQEKLEYIHANPTQRKLVTHPGDWPWSSWIFYARGEGLLKIDPLRTTRERTAKKQSEERPTLSKTERVGHPRLFTSR